MAPQLTCTSCSGTFGPTIFANRHVLICRFCNLRKVISDDLKVALQEIAALKEKVKALEEFATLNVAVTPELEVTITTPSSPTPTPSPQTTITTNTNPVPPQEEFHTVTNGVRPRRRNFLPITMCQNRFQLLPDQVDVDDNEEVRLVGDSMVRGQLTEFCSRAPRTRKRFCIPGGGVDDVTAAIDEVANLAPNNTTYVIHVGTNDVVRTRSEVLIEKYKDMIRTYKERSHRIIISGIIPRIQAGRRFYNIATSVNRRLATICREENVGFIDMWDNFYYDKSLFADDGVHLNEVGAARFGRLLSGAVSEYRSKNGTVHALPSQEV